MSYWIKHFNNKKIISNNLETQGPLVSWSQTPLDNMTGTSLFINKNHLGIFGKGNYWQYDTYEFNFSEGRSVLISRSIQRLIVPSDAIIGFKKDTRVYFKEKQETGDLFSFTPILTVLPEWYRHWFTWTHYIDKKENSYSIRKNKG